MTRHKLDITAFLFGLVFLLTAALAFSAQAGAFGIGSSDGNTWVAAVVLLVAGGLALICTLIAGAVRSPETVVAAAANSSSASPSAEDTAPLPFDES